LLKGRGFEPSSSSGKDGAHMMNEWFEAITPDVMADLFEDLLAEASEEENISIWSLAIGLSDRSFLFGLFSKWLFPIMHEGHFS
jgi:hypothetical protein